MAEGYMTQGAYNAGYGIDDIKAETNAKNSGGGRGGGGGGILPANAALGMGNNGWYDSNLLSGKVNPELEFQKQQAAFKNAQWAQTFGMLNDQLGRMGSQNPYTIGGGTVGNQPTINANPVWNPQQINQQVNSIRANTDAQAATQMRRNNASVVGRGFGGGSPLLAALNNSTANSAMATGTDAERNFRQQAAQTNATQVLKGQQAQEQQFASRQAESIERAKPYFQQTNALISALASMA